jgi:nitrite reductase (NADH) small subunit
MAEFIKVASLAELPQGSAKSVSVQGKDLALFNVGGTIYATDNTCLHQGGPLGEGILQDGVITCPWHMWEYNVRTGEKLGNPEIRVATYPVRVEGSDIEVAV